MRTHVLLLIGLATAISSAARGASCAPPAKAHLQKKSAVCVKKTLNSREGDLARVLFRPGQDRVKARHPLYRPGLDKFRISHPIYRPGIDRFYVYDLTGYSLATDASAAAENMKQSTAVSASKFNEDAYGFRGLAVPHTPVIEVEGGTSRCARKIEHRTL